MLFRQKEMDKNKIFIITGTRGGGKTQFLKDLHEFLSLFEKNIRGFICKGILNDKGGKDFYLKDLSSENKELLATRIVNPDSSENEKYLFKPKAVDLGNKIIEEAVIDQCQILIIDGIGPYELSNKIWHQSFSRVLNNYKGILIISTRKKMIEYIMDKYLIHEAFVEDIDITSPRITGNAILSILNLS